MSLSSISYLQIVEMASPLTVEKYMEQGYGNFKVKFKDPHSGGSMRQCRLIGQPVTRCPSFIISGRFKRETLKNGIVLRTVYGEKYTYKYKNPGKVDRHDVNYMVRQMELNTKKTEADRKALFDAVPCSVSVFKQLPQFESLKMETLCDFFRAEYEMKLLVAFPKQHTEIRDMKAPELRTTVSLLDGLIWKLWFDRYTRPLGLKEMTQQGYNAYLKAYPRLQPLPVMYTRAFRIYNFLKQLRTRFGHDMFPKRGLYHEFLRNNQACTEEEFENSMRFLLAQGLNDVGLEDNLAFRHDLRSNLTLMSALNDITKRGRPRVRDVDEVPCKPSAQLTDRQRQFVQHVFENSITLLQGPPGTGKTEGLVALMAHFATPLVVTFGGRMVCALQERFGQREETAHTIHHVCCVSEFNRERGAEWLQEFDVLIIDEGSNVDARLMARLLHHMRHIKRLVIVGDLGQIFPINPGAPFYDLIHGFPQHCFVLNENKRVDPDARVLADVSAMLNRGELPEHFDQEALQLHENRTRDMFEQVFACYRHSVMDVQIVTLTNKSRTMLNEWAEEYLINSGLLPYKRNAIKLGAHEYFPGKKIMFTQNNNAPEGGYKNGELGEIASIANNPVRITLTNGKTVVVKDIQDICPGYATTCNKSQGSEWKHIIFWVCDNHHMFSREHAYVAVSRAKKHCHLMVNNLQDLQALVSRQANRRKTLLNYMLERDTADHLKVTHPFEQVQLLDTDDITTLLPKDCAAVPVYQKDDDDEYGGKTTKKDKRRKIANIFDTMAEFE